MEKICGLCAWCDNGMYCRKKHKDVGYFGQESCYTTQEEYKLLFAQEITKIEEDNKLNQDAKMAENTNVKTKVCKDCGRELPIEMFHRQSKSKDGYMHICGECKKKRMIVALAKKKETPSSIEEQFKKLMQWSEYKEKKPDQTAPTECEENFKKLETIATTSDQELVDELRSRGYEVTCTKTISL